MRYRQITDNGVLALIDYHYLTADSATERPKKKRKKTKQVDTAADGPIITDDDPLELKISATNMMNDDEGRPAVVTCEAADAIIDSAAAENATRRNEGDNEDAPAIEGEEEDDAWDGVGCRAGLQTATQTAAMVAAQERRKKAEASTYKESPAGEQVQETIHRDMSGRINNVAMKRAEVRRAEEEKREEAQAKEALMGDAFQPYRNGIRSGQRWDRVDRSNGSEKEWFAARNRTSRLETLDYEWRMDE
ncbi:hypothetical protein BO79DRAFT_224843 [Aspergillus costaricaensis CBS 115574]|uniref:Uncharacterized protein n=1 Tax=Aspergillus costaricaensis CBS 115574 TaxID=1448317 RepID=A0ACD1IR34_9EURO|nr:hypothetical protein BO79DRAFT_224843 [Aspergillus costaricaensis CBS 115574]RAK92528.1 hypothetical protein BO79DRAFT_224843 [Aspergillus costaricaensis CBS 115574]